MSGELGGPMSEDAMREAIARRLADYDALYPLTDAEWEAMRDVGAGDYFGQADAVLAVRGVDADQWEQHRAQMTEAGSWAETLETGRVGYGIAAAVVDAILADFARRVVPVVPSPEPPRTMDTGLVEVRQVRCPTCGSEYRLTYLAPCHLGGADPWHSAEAPDGRVVAQWRGPHNVEVTPPDAVLGEQA